MTQVRVVALGSRTACDDEAALRAAEALSERADVVLAGRPGPGLVDLLEPDRPVVLVDVISAGLSPGHVISVPLHELPNAVLEGQPLSSHGLGPAEALRLSLALGRTLPPGIFVGVQGQTFEPGHGISEAVTAAHAELVAAIEAAIETLAGPSTGAQDDA